MSLYPTRIKTLNVIAENQIQKIGELEAGIAFVDEFPELSNVTVEALNKIQITFEQIGEPFFTMKIIKNKVINCGFIQFVVKDIILPPEISGVAAELLLILLAERPGLFPGAIISIPLQGETEVSGVRNDDDIEEFFDVEGITTCFLISSENFTFAYLSALLFAVHIKVAVNVRIVVSRIVLATANVRNIEDVTDFDGDNGEDDDSEDNEC